MTFSIQGSEILFIVLWCLQFLLCIACAIVIVLFRNNQSMRARAPVLSSLSSIGAATYLGAYTLSYSIPGTPCSLIVLVANVSFYVLWAPLLLRAWRIYFIYHWNSKMIAEQKKQEEISKERRNARNLNKKLQNKAKGETAEDGLGDNPPPQQPQKPSTSTRGWRHNNQDDLQTDQISVLDVEDVPTLMDATEVSEMMRKQKATNTSNVNKRRAEESNLVKFFVIMLIVVVVLMLPVSLAYPGLCPHDFLCQINERETNNPIMTYILYPRLVVPLMFIVDIMLLIEVIMLREVNDSYSLNTEIRVATVISIIGTIFLAVLSFTNLSFAFVVMAQIWVQAIHCTCSYYPVILLAYNALRKKTGMSMSELGKMEIPNSIEKMLENGVTRELFKRYLLKALCSETILFYEQVLSYKKATADERSQMAPNIIENYIKDDALNEINIAGKVKKRIIHRYNQITYDDEVPIDLFDIAIEKLKLVLNENGTYQNFLESSEFKQYVKKVKNNKKIKEIEVAGGI